jgi:hypothetical protein
MQIKTEIKEEVVTTVVKKPVKLFILTKREATLVRDILGGSEIKTLFENSINRGFNRGNWTKDQFYEQYYSLYQALNEAI